MRTVSCAGLLLALVVAPLTAQQDSTAMPQDSTQLAVKPITLSQALLMAVRTQPAVVQAEGNLDVAHASQRAAIGNYLPSLSASSGWSRNSSGARFDPTTQTTINAASTSWNGGLRLNLTLFDGFAREARNRLASAGISSADAALTNQRFQIELQTKQAFFNALAADELVRAGQEQLKTAKDQLKISRDKLLAGSATRADTLTSTVQVANAQLTLLNAQTQRETAQAQLARLVGSNELVRPVADSSLYVLPQIDTLELRREAIDNSPSVQTAAANVKTAQAQVAVSRAQYFPSINAGYSNSLGGTALDQLRHSWSMSVSLSWNIFNGFTRESNMASSDAQRNYAQSALADARRQASTNLTTQLAALASAEQRISIAKVSGAAADENLRVQQERYRVGAATIVDVQTAEASVASAASDLVRARLDFLVARAQIEALIGRTL